MKTAHRRRRNKARPMRLRYHAQHQVIGRLLLLGWTAEKIAKKLGCTARAVRYAIPTPEFETFFNDFQRRHLQARQIGSPKAGHGPIVSMSEHAPGR